MGTDIHLAVEHYIDGEWVNVTPFREDDGYLSNYPNGYYESRNYGLFAILADVRNGLGFAGVVTGDGYVPIHPQRGIPSDASSIVRRWCEEGDHSHSWATVKELLEYDWTQTTVRRGVVDIKEFMRFKLWGKPESWCGAIGGHNIKHISNDEMLDRVYLICEKYGQLTYADFHRLKNLPSRLEGSYTAVEWSQPYYDVVQNFLHETMPKLWRVGKPENVRIVYWFDS
jgi:hypothetical protein